MLIKNDCFSSVTIYIVSGQRMITLVSVLVIPAHVQCYNFIIEYIMIHHTHIHTKNSYSRVHTQNNTETFANTTHTIFNLTSPTPKQNSNIERHKNIRSQSTAFQERTSSHVLMRYAKRCSDWATATFSNKSGPKVRFKSSTLVWLLSECCKTCKSG